MKRILVYPWHSYNYADTVAAFTRLGYEISYIEYHLDDYEEDEEFLELGKRLLSEKVYDFVFSVNYFPVISVLCSGAGVRYVSWTCDNPLISMFHDSVFNDCNIIFTFDMTNLAQFNAMGVKNIHHLPLAFDFTRVDDYLARAKDTYLYENEVSFVGSLYERNTFDRVRPHLSDYLKGYLEAVICAQKLVTGGNIIEDMLSDEVMLLAADEFELKKSEKSFSSLRLIFSTTVLGFKVASEMRREALIALGRRFDTALYTNSRVSEGEFPGVRLMGEVDYFTQMPKVFRGTRVNINLTIPNIVSGIPLRAFDIMGSGGFLLSDPRPEFPLFFKRGEDYDCFESVEEMVEKCDFYLAHEDERKRIAANAREKIGRSHNYDVRLEEMMRIVDSYP